jgi:hypothetical protein
MDREELAEYLAEVDADTPYYEMLMLDPESPAWWACNRDGREIQPGVGCPDHAPRNIPGLYRIDCDNGHGPMWVADGDHCGYGLPCPRCMYEQTAADLAKATKRDRCRHWAWHRWPATRLAVRWAYRLGVISGSTWSWGGGLVDGAGCDGCVTFRFDLHPRPYVLGAARSTWRCWSRGHRRGEEVGFGFCGKCVPWPCCGATRRAHADGCVEDIDQSAPANT